MTIPQRILYVIFHIGAWGMIDIFLRWLDQDTDTDTYESL